MNVTRWLESFAGWFDTSAPHACMLHTSHLCSWGSVVASKKGKRNRSGSLGMRLIREKYLWAVWICTLFQLLPLTLVKTVESLHVQIRPLLYLNKLLWVNLIHAAYRCSYSTYIYTFMTNSMSSSVSVIKLASLASYTVSKATVQAFSSSTYLIIMIV